MSRSDALPTQNHRNMTRTQARAGLTLAQRRKSVDRSGSRSRWRSALRARSRREGCIQASTTWICKRHTPLGRTGLPACARKTRTSGVYTAALRLRPHLCDSPKDRLRATLFDGKRRPLPRHILPSPSERFFGQAVPPLHPFVSSTRTPRTRRWQQRSRILARASGTGGLY